MGQDGSGSENTIENEEDVYAIPTSSPAQE